MNRTLFFQCLLSVLLIAFAGMAALTLLAGSRSSQQSNVAPVEDAHDPVSADRAAWNQFYDAVSVRRFDEAGRPAQAAQPADEVPENRATNDIADTPAAPRLSADQVPIPGGAPVTATTSPDMPHAAPGELTAKPAPLPGQTAALPERPHDRSDNAAAPTEPARDQEPREAATPVTTTESTPPAAGSPLPAVPVATLDANAEQATQTKTSPVTPPAVTPPAVTPPAVTPPVPMPRARAAVPVPPVRGGARVKQAAPEEREPERSRPSAPPRARVALPKQRQAPVAGPPQQQSGAMSYAPPQYEPLPPGGPQFGPYFPYGSRPPSAQQLRASQQRTPQPFYGPADDPRQYAPQPRQPAQSFNNPYGWR